MVIGVSVYDGTEEIPSGAIIHHEEDVVFIFDDFVKSDDIGVV